MNRGRILLLLLCAGAAIAAAAPHTHAQESAAPAQPARTIRIGAAQPKARLIDYRITDPQAVLAEVEKNIGALEDIVRAAGAARCDVVAFPEDTLGLGKWEAAHRASLTQVLPPAVQRMIERLGRAAATQRLYLICCNDTAAPDGTVRNTAFFLGRDGREIGRYHKVNMPIHELDRQRGTSFPVFNTPDLGGVGMLICYDMVFPEAARCLALGGADIIFHPTLGGAAIGDDDIARAAIRTRAVENFVYLVVAQRGSGSMIVSPQGKIIAEGKETLVIADIDPFGGREGGDAMNHQADMRARLFRERSPAAFGVLTQPNPPALAKVPETMSIPDAVRISSGVLTTGEDRFKAADALVRQGKTNEAIAAFQALRRDYRQSWIDRVAQTRLAQLNAGTGANASASAPAAAPATSARSPAMPRPIASYTNGIAAKYPRDAGIAHDPRVLFAENFEDGTADEIGKRWGQISNKDGKVIAFSRDVPPASAGKRSLQMTATLDENTGGHLYTRLRRGVDKIFARFYVKFPADGSYVHHFVTLGGYHPATAWPQGGAGELPRGDERFTVGIEPYGNYGRYPPPGAWNFYTYWHEMKVSAGNRYWGNSLTPAEPALIPRDRWQCVEVMVQCNSAPEKSDGELALWVDGKPAAHFYPGARRSNWTGMGFSLAAKDGETMEGFRWRTSADLNINFFWLLYYVTDNAARQNRVPDAKRTDRVWFDDIVLGTEYIGPIRP